MTLPFAFSFLTGFFEVFGTKVLAESSPGVPDLEMTAFFSSSVSLNSAGDKMIVGAGSKDESALADAGAAYIYSFNGSTWVLDQKITAESSPGVPDIVAAAKFGESVAMNAAGDRVIVGAFVYPSLGVNASGAAYIYFFNGVSWVVEQRIEAQVPPSTNDSQIGAFFGRRVAINDAGTRVAAGAESYDLGGNSAAGACYVYTRSGSTWSIEQRITAESSPGTPDVSAGDAFGIRLDFNSVGDKIIITSLFKVVGGFAGAGASYVYALSGTWVLEQKITAESSPGVPDSGFAYRFGDGVGLNGSGDKVIIGATTATSAGTGAAGAAYIYFYNGASWILEQKIGAESDVGIPDDQGSAQFGVAVAINDAGTFVSVGAPYKTISPVVNSGATYVYAFKGSWVYQQRISAESTPGVSDLEILPFFGNRLSMSSNGRIIAIAAPVKDESGGGNSDGAVYVYK